MGVGGVWGEKVVGCAVAVGAAVWAGALRDTDLDLADGQAGVDGVVGRGVLVGEVRVRGRHVAVLQAKGQRLVGRPVHHIVKVGCGRGLVGVGGDGVG